jgi:chromate transporter
MSAFLDAVNIASVAVILVVIAEMAKVTLLDWRTIVIALLSFAITFRYKKLNTAFVVIGGAALGYLLHISF